VRKSAYLKYSNTGDNWHFVLQIIYLGPELQMCRFVMVDLGTVIMRNVTNNSDIASLYTGILTHGQEVFLK